MQYRVIKDYNDAPAQAIKLCVDEQLQVIEESNPVGDWPNWVFCKGESKQGWVPKQILNIEGEVAICSKNYDATEHNVTVGDIIIANEGLNGWVYGIKNGVQETLGWAPLNCLEKV